MKKLLFLFSALLFISCSKEDTDLGLDDPNKPLSEKLASITSPDEYFYEIYNESSATFKIHYFMQAGYVLHEEIVSDNWGNNELSLDCYHERTSDHKISDITVMNDTFNSFVWENNGRTFSLSLNENILTYKQGS